MKTYTVEISEKVSQCFQIEASSPEEAEAIAHEKYMIGEIEMDDPQAYGDVECCALSSKYRS